MFLILGSKEINKTLSFPSTILQSSVMFLVKCTAFYYDAKNTMTFHSTYEVLCFKTMAKRDILILLFKKPTETNKQKKAHVLHSQILHGSLTVKRASPQKACSHSSERKLNSSSNGVTSDLILTETSISMHLC